MEYTFSWGTFFFGLMIVLAGAGLVVWFKPIADNIGGGVSNYDRYKLYGLIAVGVGFIIMTGLHTLLLGWILNPLFNRG